MDKREFYKELMKEYTFDSAKVRRSAKTPLARERRGKLKWAIPSAVLVAASLVFGVFTLLNDRGIPTVLTGDGRIREANSAVEKVVKSFEPKAIYLSFNEGITLTEMKKTFDDVSSGGDNGDIIVESLYVIDSSSPLWKTGDDDYFEFEAEATDSKPSPKTLTRVIKSSDIDKESEKSGDFEIVGAKVFAPAILVADLNKQGDVALLEFEDERINDNTFVPLVIESIIGGETTADLDNIEDEPATTEPSSSSDDHSDAETTNETNTSLDDTEDDLTSETPDTTETAMIGEGTYHSPGEPVSTVSTPVVTPPPIYTSPHDESNAFVSSAISTGGRR